MVGGQICESLHFSRGPGNVGFIHAVVAAEPEVQAKIGLGEIAAAADDFAGLDEIAGSRPDAGVQRKTIALRSLQFEADPVIRREPLGLQDERLALEIFNDDIDWPVVKYIPISRSSSNARNLDGGAHQFADVFEFAVA